jgi:hypothetical protein
MSERASEREEGLEGRGGGTFFLGNGARQTFGKKDLESLSQGS